MIVGCVKEIMNNEFRVGIVPDHVNMYVKAGHSFLIEKDAGIEAGFTNEEYEKAGAKIIDNAQEVWERSEMIIKVKEPQVSEYELMKENQIIFTYFHLAANRKLTLELLKRKVTAVAYETITDEDGRLPLLKPMSEIAGRLSIQEGAKYLEKQFGGSGVLLSGVSGVPRGKVLVLGAGVVGQNAVRTAVGLGAYVVVMDKNMERLEELDMLYQTSVQTVFMTEGALLRELDSSDVIVGSILVPGENTPKVLRKEHLKLMKPGSVIVDVAVDQGGCAETSRPTTHDNPIFIEDGIIHYCVSNMPGCVPFTSTNSLVNATMYYGLHIAGAGIETAAQFDPHLALGINCYQGHLTHKGLAHSLEMTYTDPLSLMKE